MFLFWNLVILFDFLVYFFLIKNRKRVFILFDRGNGCDLGLMFYFDFYNVEQGLKRYVKRRIINATKCGQVQDAGGTRYDLVHQTSEGVSKIYRAFMHHSA